MNGIDISQFNTITDWQKIKDSGIEFVIIREGYRKQIDSKFLENVKGALSVGLSVMTYHFLYTNNATIKENAESTVANLKAAGLDPEKTFIWCDLEYDTWTKNGETCTREKCSAYTEEYLKELKNLGCNSTGIYMNNDYYTNYYTDDLKNAYPIWLADWNGEPDHECAICQYSSTGSVDGITGNVDLDKMEEEISMSTNYIGNCGRGESGYNTQKAGDQTGKEFCVREMYYPYGTPVYRLRYPDEAIARHVAADYAKLAKADYTGYDQDWHNGRNTLYEDLKANNWSVDTYLKTKHLNEADCSASVYAVWCCYVPALRYYYETQSYSEYNYHNCTTTYCMIQYWKKAGFEVASVSTADYQKPGDVYLYELHHTYMGINYGAKMTGVSHDIEYSLASAPVLTASDKTTTTTATANTVTTTAVNKQYKITASSLNIRSTYNTACSILGAIAKGVTVTVTAISSNGWGKVTYNGVTGWICLTYASEVATTTTTTTTATKTETAKVTSLTPTSKTVFAVSKSGTPSKTVQFVGTVTVTPTTETLNVRQWAGSDYDLCSFGPFANGTKINVCDAILASNGQPWYYISTTHNKKTVYGFVWAKCVK